MAVEFAEGVDRDQAAAATGVSADLFEILVCPVDKHDLRLEETVLVCPQCGRRYPIAEGIPSMLVDEST